jgi:hypothetical protein
MLRNLTGFLFGESSSIPIKPSAEKILETDDWVLVDGKNQENVDEVSCMEAEVKGDGEDEIVLKTSRRLKSFPRISASSMAASSCSSSSQQIANAKKMKAAQSVRINKSSKEFNAKGTERKNRTAKQCSNKKKGALKNNLQIKAAGYNKQLKQC